MTAYNIMTSGNTDNANGKYFLKRLAEFLQRVRIARNAERCTS